MQFYNRVREKKDGDKKNNQTSSALAGSQPKNYSVLRQSYSNNSAGLLICFSLGCVNVSTTSR